MSENKQVIVRKDRKTKITLKTLVDMHRCAIHALSIEDGGADVNSQRG